MSHMRSLTERFWDKVAVAGPDDCWIWTGALKENGYGVIQRGRRGEGVIRAHRLSYEIANGSIPSGALVMHRCNNKRCVNPRHLSSGDHSANLRDAWEDGIRAVTPKFVAVGDLNRKLTAKAVREIRSRYATGTVPLRVLAQEYGLSISGVHSVVSRGTWDWLGP